MGAAPVQGWRSPGAHAWAGLRCSAAGSLNAGSLTAGSFPRRAAKSGMRRFCSRCGRESGGGVRQAAGGASGSGARRRAAAVE